MGSVERILTQDLKYSPKPNCLVFLTLKFDSEESEAVLKSNEI